MILKPFSDRFRPKLKRLHSTSPTLLFVCLDMFKIQNCVVHRSDGLKSQMSRRRKKNHVNQQKRVDFALFVWTIKFLKLESPLSPANKRVDKRAKDAVAVLPACQRRRLSAVISGGPGEQLLHPPADPGTQTQPCKPNLANK